MCSMLIYQNNETIPISSGGYWDANDSCCIPKCSSSDPCPFGDGPCSADDQCADGSYPTGFAICASQTCLDQEYFPNEQYPNNTLENFEASDRCCRQRCLENDKCGHGLVSITTIISKHFCFKKI